MILINCTSGIKKSGRIVDNNDKRCPNVFALFARSIRPRILRLCRIGTSDMCSTPPATITSYVPVAIRPMPVVIAYNIRIFNYNKTVKLQTFQTKLPDLR